MQQENPEVRPVTSRSRIQTVQGTFSNPRYRPWLTKKVNVIFAEQMTTSKTSLQG